MSCYKEPVPVSIHGWGGDGAGVGRLPDGKAVFVDQALPGETVLVQVTKEKKNCAWARLEQVIEPAPSRATARCPAYGICGGCSLQHMDDQAQQAYKRDQVAQALRRIGKLGAAVEPVLPAAEPWGYRNRVVFHVQQEPELSLGLYQEKSRRLVTADCLLLAQPLRELAFVLRSVLPSYREQLSALREVALRCDGTGRRLLLTLVANRPLTLEDELVETLRRQEPRLVSLWENSGPPVYGVYGADWRKLWGEDRLQDRLAGVELELPPAAFLQVNHVQAERMYALVRQGLEPLEGRTLLDVYAGVGSIGLSMADVAGQVIGVESYGPSVAAAQRNSLLNGAENCRFLWGGAEQVLPDLARQGMQADRLVVDPPRAGCEPAALAAIAAMGPERLVYVSCDPATLSRDLAFLVAAGYRIETVQPIDMFPQSHHVETVVLLSKVQK